MNIIIKRAALLALPAVALGGLVLANNPDQMEVHLMQPTSDTSADAQVPTSTSEPMLVMPAPAAVPVAVEAPAPDPEPPVVTTTTAAPAPEPVVEPAPEPEPVIEEPVVIEEPPVVEMCGPLPCCPPVTYDGILPQDGGTGPVWDTPDGLPPTYDCNGPGYVELPPVEG